MHTNIKNGCTQIHPVCTHKCDTVTDFLLHIHEHACPDVFSLFLAPAVSEKWTKRSGRSRYRPPILATSEEKKECQELTPQGDHHTTPHVFSITNRCCLDDVSSQWIGSIKNELEWLQQLRLLLLQSPGCNFLQSRPIFRR